MRKNWLKYLIRIVAFVIVIYAIHRLLFPAKVVAPTQKITPPETQVEFGVGYNCEDLEYLSVEVNGRKEVLCGGKTGGGGASASWYGGEFNGRKTASGEIFDETKDTLACADEFELGTRFHFSYQGKTAYGTCNDRGAFEELGRKFDLSRGLFERLAPKERGVIQVDYAIVDSND